ncbi:MAG: HAD-IIA family hydrolase [Candidatus Geothermincolia bacterium]
MPLVDRYKGFIIDLDGVIYLSHDPIPGSAEAVTRLQRDGAAFVFLTNNSVATPEQYVTRLAGFGIDVEPRQVVTSSQAVGVYLDRNFETRGKSAVVIGEQGLLAELERRGLKVLDPAQRDGADFVFVGWDRNFDFAKLRSAVIALQKGATFIATNRDATYPTPQGLWPGAGTMVAAVATGGEKEPFVAGKPNPFIVEIALERMGLEKGEALMVGDRLDSDIEAGAAAGVDTVLVLTGVSGVEEVERTGIRPTHVRNDLAGLFE